MSPEIIFFISNFDFAFPADLWINTKTQVHLLGKPAGLVPNSIYYSSFFFFLNLEVSFLRLR